MEKRIITLIIALGFGLNLSAQSDGFFKNSNYSEYREDAWASEMPLLPTSHGTQYDFSADQAPLGNGLLLLGGLALAYGIRKKNS